MWIWRSGSGGSSAAGDPGHCERGAEVAVARFRRAVLADRAGVDPAGAAAAGVAAAGVLFDPLGAATGRADRHRPAVPLVRRAGHRRSGVGRHHLHQEPRPAAGRRGGGEVPRRGAGARQGQGPVVERAFLGRRHAAGGLGQHQELPPQGRLGQPPDPGRNGEHDFRGEKRSNDTHASTTDPMPGCSARAGQGGEARASWAMR